MDKNYKICNYCIMDTSDPDIVFDNNNQCNHCKTVLNRLKQEPFNLTEEEKEKKLMELVNKIKKDGKNKKYDCLIGVSGGVDSTYVAYFVKKLGLRPLAVHLDNGWDTELSVNNIELTLKKLNIDLYTKVLDWEEFKDIQLSFLKSSTPGLEVPTDHAILATLIETAKKFKINYILSGINYNTESILPLAWGNNGIDWKNISAIQKQFGTKKIKHFPHLDLFKTSIDLLTIKQINILNYTNYNKNDVVKIIESEIGWKNYKTKHGESTFTFFMQAYILPVKFNFDKRRAHLSSLICSNQITREYALEQMEKSLYTDSEIKELTKLVCDKLNITADEFTKLMKLKNKKYTDYPNIDNSLILKILKKGYKIIKFS